MTRRTLTGLIIVVCLLCVPRPVCAENDDMTEYPDGGYGMDLGGGYQTTPDGRLIAPGGYRDPYLNTQYGALTQDGSFENFPGFKLPGSSAADNQRANEKELIEQKSKELKFHAATTSSAGSLYWGVYDPAGKE